MSGWRRDVKLLHHPGEGRDGIGAAGGERENPAFAA